MVIDLDGLTIEEVARSFPKVYQHVLDRVKPERDQNREPYRRDVWWLFGRRNTELRAAINGVRLYIATVETSKFRTFSFLDEDVLPDNKLIAIGLDDAYFLGVLSSEIHTLWSLTVGGNLGEGNDPVYLKTVCFEQFPFPIPNADQLSQIRCLGDRLDAHRKARQAEHPTLTLTGMYNVLAKLRSGEALTDKDRVIHEQGLVSVLRQIHDDLDAAVFDAYGWPRDLADEDILRRLVALNRERAEEERRGLIRWLRPEFQAPAGTAAPAPVQAEFAAVAEPEPPTPGVSPKAKRPPWPKSLPEQAQAVRAALAASPGGLTAARLAKSFTRGQAPRAAELLDTLVSLGQARAVGDGSYVPS